jgi:hypothetical protein
VAASAEVFEGDFKVYNKTENDTKVEISLWDVEISEQGSSLALEAGSTKRSAAPWTKFDTQNLKLKAGEEKQIKYKIEVPKEASGSYFALLFFDEEPSVQEGEVPIGVRIGVPVYVTIKGTEVYSGEIEEIEQKAKLKVKFKNTGNVYVRPEGKVKIMDLNNNKKDEFLLTEYAPVLPESSRVFEKELTEEQERSLPPRGKGKFLVEMSIGQGKVIKKEVVQ